MIGCKKLKVPKDICSIEFGEDRQMYGESYETCRHEMMILHFNKDHKVVEIELLGNDKPCQLKCPDKPGP
jgi:hypothetical protein